MLKKKSIFRGDALEAMLGELIERRLRDAGVQEDAITPDLTFKQLHELELKPNSPFGALRVVATNLLANPHSRDDTPVKSLTWFGCESEVGVACNAK